MNGRFGPSIPAFERALLRLTDATAGGVVDRQSKGPGRKIGAEGFNPNKIFNTC